MWGIFKKKPKEKNITGKEMHDIFYNLYYYYDTKCANIGVLKNKAVFEWQLKVWKGKMNKSRGDSVIKINNDRYLFIIDEQEINIVLIRNIESLHENQIKFRRYMD